MLHDEDTLPKWDEPNGTRGVVLEDDGRSVYAYLLDGARIVAAVWLYNSTHVTDVRWDDPDQLPFPNKPENIDTGEHLVIEDATAVECRWDERGVDVYFDGVYSARLENATSVGWSRTIKVDSPVGRSLGRKALTR